MIAVVPLRPRLVYATASIFLALMAPIFAMALPDPEQVAADFPDRKTRAAAYVVMLTQINHNGLPEEAAAKYRLALGEIDPPWKPEHRQFTEEYHAISDQPEFQYSIVQKYLPQLAGRVAGQIQESAKARRDQILTEKFANAGLILVGVMLAVPLLFLLWCWRGKWAGPLIPDNVAGPLRIPDDLRRIKVFRKHYSVVFDCGQIYDKTKEQESYTRTWTSSGRQYTVGNTTYIEPGQTTTTYHTINYDRFTFATPDGRSTWAQTQEGTFHAIKGHIISYVSYDKALLCIYNHTTNNFVKLTHNLAHPHRYPGKWIWGATVVAIGLATYLLKDYLSAGYASETVGSWSGPVVYAMLGFGIVSPIYVLLVKWMVELVRRLEFKWRYEPRLRKFFEQCTPSLMQRFPPLPGHPDVRPAN